MSAHVLLNLLNKFDFNSWHNITDATTCDNKVYKASEPITAML